MYIYIYIRRRLYKGQISQSYARKVLIAFTGNHFLIK